MAIFRKSLFHVGPKIGEDRTKNESGRTIPPLATTIGLRLLQAGIAEVPQK
jgi:hypothetical protein